MVMKNMNCIASDRPSPNSNVSQLCLAALSLSFLISEMGIIIQALSITNMPAIHRSYSSYFISILLFQNFYELRFL